MKIFKISVFTMVFIILSVSIGTQTAAAIQNEDHSLDVTISEPGILFQPGVPYTRLSVTISDPLGEIFTRSFTGSSQGFVAISQLNDTVRDGVYNYEAVLTLENGKDNCVVKSGYFRVINGQAIKSNQPSSGSDDDLSGAQYHINETLYVTGNLSIGLDMTDGTAIPYATMMIKDNNCQIKFDDTSTSTGFPNNDWRLQANDVFSGGADYFAIKDETNSTFPFTIQAAAPSNSLYVDSQGDIGIGTSTPSSNLHIWDTGSASLKLERSTGAQVEMYAGSGYAYFGTRDDYSLHFISNSFYRMTIGNTGNIGIGNTSPSHLLDLSGGAYCDGTNWVDASSREYKENIANLSEGDALKTLKGLNPVTFNYKSRKDDTSVGFIAEDVPELVATKDRKGLSTMDIIAVLTRVVQQQQKRLDEQEKLIRQLLENKKH